jgi:hypothetical protein
MKPQPFAGLAGEKGIDILLGEPGCPAVIVEAKGADEARDVVRGNDMRSGIGHGL